MANVGNVKEAWQDELDRVRRPIRTVALAWTADASGSVMWTLASGAESGLLSGLIHRVVFVPGTGGSQPSSGYGVTLADSNGVDLLAGQGAGLSSTAASQYVPTAPVAVDDICTLHVSAAGAEKSGTVVIYLR